ncbi:Lrp/AsnC family transcriptional regulator [Calidifontibacter sp. DB0510]|uniref:Lrp/AsnC family transcriptional regulator n=1 Tax=Metallococcus carri TaxID=1656884 RepID=A0A967EA64_9MICO|nr:Lrp/AsnC ligand binding domain-containing protein [Metallococcus carri]NHN55950.1 Lrp/AsnC family transcriptional regulator [Metallococcus carri]NOP37593.1 Lrp/AsnC ligand binding domain-containing protein [Calidifontibacter sp. DB2511S]
MISAIVMIQADVDKIPEVAEAIAEVDGVAEVYSVTGECDLIALVKVPRHEDFHDVIADRINKIPGMRESRTHIAFRTYSKNDLGAAFAIGLDE